MNNSKIFTIQQFLSLSDSELVAFSEQYVNNDRIEISDSAYGPLQSRLNEMDEFHKVYAIEICMLLNPMAFKSHAIQYLSDSCSSVCCAACRAIEKMPRVLVTDELVEMVAAAPIVDVYSSDIHTGERICIGTNETFIRVLIEKLSL